MDAPSMSGRCNLFLPQTDRAYRVVGDGSRDGLVDLMSSLDRPSIQFPSIYLYGWVGYCRGGVYYLWMIPRYWGSFGCFSLPFVVFFFCYIGLVYFVFNYIFILSHMIIIFFLKYTQSNKNLIKGIVEREEKKISPKSLIITIFLATQKMKELLDTE